MLYFCVPCLSLCLLFFLIYIGLNPGSPSVTQRSHWVWELWLLNSGEGFLLLASLMELRTPKPHLDDDSSFSSSSLNRVLQLEDPNIQTHSLKTFILGIGISKPQNKTKEKKPGYQLSRRYTHEKKTEILKFVSFIWLSTSFKEWLNNTVNI